MISKCFRTFVTSDYKRMGRLLRPNLPEYTIVNDIGYKFPHAVYKLNEVEKVTVSHQPPDDIQSKIGLGLITLIRGMYDKATGFPHRMTKEKFIKRVCMLETVAAVPGMVGGSIRHYKSLRKWRYDLGWIHTLMEEAENERTHLQAFLDIGMPSSLFKLGASVTCRIFKWFYTLLYMISPITCHRAVGYLEEQAVISYTKILDEIDKPNGILTDWKTLPCPKIGVSYWKLPSNATVRDLILVIRADEVIHREVNHYLADIGPRRANELI
jgi:hypothetical protein